MRALGPPLACLCMLVASASGALAFHEEELPVRFERTLPSSGWLALRFDPAGATIEGHVSARTQGPLLLQALFYDENDSLSAWSQAFTEDMGNYVRVSTPVAPARAALPGILLAGGSMQAYRMAPCGGGTGFSYSTTGNFGSGFRVPTSCNGHTLHGAILSVTGPGSSSVSFQLRSDGPLDVTTSRLERGGHFADAAEFEGVSAEIVAGRNFEQRFTRGFAHGATYTLDAEHALIGASFEIRNQPPGGEESPLQYEHGDDAGPCPCRWLGDDGTRGEWTFRLDDGLRDTRVYVAGIDAALPPP